MIVESFKCDLHEVYGKLKDLLSSDNPIAKAYKEGKYSIYKLISETNEEVFILIKKGEMEDFELEQEIEEFRGELKNDR